MKVGKFAAAGEGTILLDEIDTLALDQQANLLRVIETGEYEPVGSKMPLGGKRRLYQWLNSQSKKIVPPAWPQSFSVSTVVVTASGPARRSRCPVWSPAPHRP